MSVDQQAVVQQLRERGFAVLRAVLPPELVDDLREQVRAVYDKHGWLEPGTGPGDLVPSGRRRDGVPGWWRFAEDVQRIELFHSLAHHEALRDFARNVVGGPALHHSRRHLTTVNPEFWVPPHQEYTYIQGTEDFFTFHVPLTPGVPGIGGLLQVLDQRTSWTVRPLTVLPTKGVEAVCPPEDRWEDCPLKVGDCVVLHSLATRRLTANPGPGIQLAAQYRFQSVRLPLVKASIKPEHYPRLPDWPQITRGWSSTRWVRPPLIPKLVPFVMPESLESWHEVLPEPRPTMLSQ